MNGAKKRQLLSVAEAVTFVSSLAIHLGKTMIPDNSVLRMTGSQRGHVIGPKIILLNEWKTVLAIIVSGLFNFHSSRFSSPLSWSRLLWEVSNRETQTTERKEYFVTRKRLVERAPRHSCSVEMQAASYQHKSKIRREIFSTVSALKLNHARGAVLPQIKC